MFRHTNKIPGKQSSGLSFFGGVSRWEYVSVCMAHAEISWTEVKTGCCNPRAYMSVRHTKRWKIYGLTSMWKAKWQWERGKKERDTGSIYGMLYSVQRSTSAMHWKAKHHEVNGWVARLKWFRSKKSHHRCSFQLVIDKNRRWGMTNWNNCG